MVDSPEVTQGKEELKQSLSSFPPNVDVAIAWLSYIIDCKIEEKFAEIEKKEKS